MPVRAIRDPNAPANVEVSLDFFDGARVIKRGDEEQVYEIVRVDPQVEGFAPDMHDRILALGLEYLGPGYENRWNEYGRRVTGDRERVVRQSVVTTPGGFAPLAETAVSDSAELAASLGHPISRSGEPTASNAVGGDPDPGPGSVTPLTPETNPLKMAGVANEVRDPAPAPETGVPAGASRAEPVARPGDEGQAGGDRPETIAQLSTRAAGSQDADEVQGMLDDERKREGGERKGAVEALERRLAELRAE